MEKKAELTPKQKRQRSLHRLNVAMKWLQAESFDAEITNKKTCEITVHHHDQNFVFHAHTGEIVGSQDRGIVNFVKLLHKVQKAHKAKKTTDGN